MGQTLCKTPAAEVISCCKTCNECTGNTFEVIMGSYYLEPFQ